MCLREDSSPIAMLPILPNSPLLLMLFYHCCPCFSHHQWPFSVYFCLRHVNLHVFQAVSHFTPRHASVLTGCLCITPLSWQVFAACPSLISSASLIVYFHLLHPDEAVWEKGYIVGVPWQTAPSTWLPALQQHLGTWNRIRPEQTTQGTHDINMGFAFISYLSATAEHRLKIKPCKWFMGCN